MVLPCGSNTEGFSVTKTRARMSDDALDAGKNPLEDRVDVLELLAQIESALDLLRREHASDVGIRAQQAFEVALLGERQHGVALHPLIGLLARDALPGELEQYRPGKDDAAQSIEVLAHALGQDEHVADDSCEPAQHMIQRDEAVGQDHALDRRVRDVALVPEGDVLEGRLTVSANQSREADHLLAP